MNKNELKVLLQEVASTLENLQDDMKRGHIVVSYSYDQSQRMKTREFWLTQLSHALAQVHDMLTEVLEDK